MTIEAATHVIISLVANGADPTTSTATANNDDGHDDDDDDYNHYNINNGHKWFVKSSKQIVNSELNSRHQGQKSARVMYGRPSWTATDIT